MGNVFRCECAAFCFVRSGLTRSSQGCHDVAAARRLHVHRRGERQGAAERGRGGPLQGESTLPLLSFNILVLIPVAQVSAWDLCIKMAAKGVLAKPTHVRRCSVSVVCCAMTCDWRVLQDCVIRFAPPLIMTDAQMQECECGRVPAAHTVYECNSPFSFLNRFQASASSPTCSSQSKKIATLLSPVPHNSRDTVLVPKNFRFSNHIIFLNDICSFDHLRWEFGSLRHQISRANVISMILLILCALVQVLQRVMEQRQNRTAIRRLSTLRCT